MNAEELRKVYGGFLCAPGLDVVVKLDLKISKRTVLLLSQVIDKGLTVKGEHRGNALIDATGEAELDEIRQLSSDCLDKSQLTEFSAMIMALGGK